MSDATKLNPSQTRVITSDKFTRRGSLSPPRTPNSPKYQELMRIYSPFKNQRLKSPPREPLNNTSIFTA